MCVNKEQSLILVLYWGAWVAQLVKRLALDFSPGHDHADSAEPAWDPLPLPLLSLPLLCTCSLSQNK